MLISLDMLLKLFPIPKLPTPAHHYDGAVDGVSRPVSGVTFAKHADLDNLFNLEVDYPATTVNGVQLPATKVTSTFHAFDTYHLPEQIQINGANVVGSVVRTHSGIKFALPPEPFIGFSFEWHDTSAHRADVRAYIDFQQLTA